MVLMKILSLQVCVFASLFLTGVQLCIADKYDVFSIEDEAVIDRKLHERHVYRKFFDNHQYVSTQSLFLNSHSDKGMRAEEDDCFIIDGVKYLSGISSAIPAWFGFDALKVQDVGTQNVQLAPKHAFSLPDPSAQHEDATYVLAFKFGDANTLDQENKHWLEWHLGLHSRSPDKDLLDEVKTHHLYSGLKIDIVQLMQPL